MMCSLSHVAAEGETGGFWKTLLVTLSIILLKFSCGDYYTQYVSSQGTEQDFCLIFVEEILVQNTFKALLSPLYTLQISKLHN